MRITVADLERDEPAPTPPHFWRRTLAVTHSLRPSTAGLRAPLLKGEGEKGEGKGKKRRKREGPFSNSWIRPESRFAAFCGERDLTAQSLPANVQRNVKHLIEFLTHPGV